ncbi:MAG: RagB/SusD family nutrient uptake outer membrane protein [Chitinophagaceae bacterium]|nr:RagB/SusD family nutrient uptake outer membrane protein [Chitinophagaceae bacterium]
MKRINKINCLLLVVMVLFSGSCKKLLEEKPRSQIVPSFFNTPEGLLGGLAGVYNDIRSGWGTEGHTVAQMAGTDDHLMGGSAGNPRLFTYNGIGTGDFNGAFNIYTAINTLNGILEIGPTANMPADKRTQYLAQAKFLRGFIYFYLVQTFGSVPLHTTFITVPSVADSRAPVADIYVQIIKDLTEASNDLPNTVTAPFLGKAATKPAALYYLAKAYLTRGWLNNTTADFTQAYSIASTLIANKATYSLDLWQNYADAFLPANDYGKETLFVSDHSNDPKYGLYQAGASGGNAQNVTPWLQRYNYIDVLGINSTVNAAGKITNSGGSMLFRDVNYGRPYTRLRPNIDRQTTGTNAGKNYILDQAFADRVNDSRYDKTFQTVLIANKNAAGQAAYSGPGVTGSRGTLNTGSHNVFTNAISAGADTAVWFADYAVPGAPQAFGARAFKGIIVTPTMQTNTVFPIMKKWDDPSRAAPNDPSTRPFVLARFSEVYLIAAEAAFKGGGTMQQAADMLNLVRQRAAYRTTNTPAQNAAASAAVTITAGDVTLDFILDERTRELFGEAHRWLDLVRTKSLKARLSLWNRAEAGIDNGNFKDHYVLRPIPQDQIDRVTEGACVGNACWQNPGYF